MSACDGYYWLTAVLGYGEWFAVDDDELLKKPSKKPRITGQKEEEEEQDTTTTIESSSPSPSSAKTAAMPATATNKDADAAAADGDEAATPSKKTTATRKGK